MWDLFGSDLAPSKQETFVIWNIIFYFPAKLAQAKLGPYLRDPPYADFTSSQETCALQNTVKHLNQRTFFSLFFHLPPWTKDLPVSRGCRRRDTSVDRMNGGRRPCSVHRWRPQRAPQLRTTCSRSRSEAVKLNVMECSVARGWGESRTWVKLDAKASLTTSEKSKDSGNVTTQCSFRVPSRLPRNLLKLMHKTWGRERSLTPWRRFFFLNVRVSVFKYHHSEMKKSFTHLDGVCVPHFGQKQQFSPRSSSCRKYDFKQPSWESSKRYEATGLALASAVCCHRYDSTRFSDLAGTQTFHLVPTCFFLSGFISGPFFEGD